MRRRKKDLSWAAYACIFAFISRTASTPRLATTLLGLSVMSTSSNLPSCSSTLIIPAVEVTVDRRVSPSALIREERMVARVAIEGRSKGSTKMLEDVSFRGRPRFRPAAREDRIDDSSNIPDCEALGRPRFLAEAADESGSGGRIPD